MGDAIKIAIIDDNDDYRFTMETFLKRNGFEVIAAEDGQKGLELIEKDRPDLILLDIMMETFFTGFEVAKKLLTDPDLKDIPVIAVSGIGPELQLETEKNKFIKRYFSSGNFLEKPVDKNNLLIKINEILKK